MVAPLPGAQSERSEQVEPPQGLSLMGWGIGLFSWIVWYVLDPERAYREAAEHYFFFVMALLLGLVLATAGQIWLAHQRRQVSGSPDTPRLDPKPILASFGPLELAAFVVAFFVVPLLLMKSNDIAQINAWQDKAVVWACIPASIGIVRWGWRLWKSERQTEALLAWLGALFLGVIPLGNELIQRSSFGVWAFLMIAIGWVRHLRWLQWAEAGRAEIE